MIIRHLKVNHAQSIRSLPRRGNPKEDCRWLLVGFEVRLGTRSLLCSFPGRSLFSVWVALPGPCWHLRLH